MPDVFAACVGRFYAELAERLVEGAQRVFEEAGATVSTLPFLFAPELGRPELDTLSVLLEETL